jgi:hypothetical protein
MKEDIMKRAMFAMPLSKESKNSGIMAGFEDDINDMDDEDEMTPMERTPQNPEIMMNTLRGDMRSTDARYMELAQMVGEEAAMETPPEVLAMLQQHFAMTQQPQGGIGALPQGGEMMPPPMPGQDPMAMPGQDPMAMPGQDPMAMQGAPMPMDQGPMMPPGGEGMPGPFPQGGAEQAPPTPDGMPPMQAAWGALITPAVRAAQIAGPRIAQGAQAANAALGRMFMSPQMSQPYLENLRGAGGRYTAEQIARGGNLMQPTFTQGLKQGLKQLAAQDPKSGPALERALVNLLKTETAATLLATLDLPSKDARRASQNRTAQLYAPSSTIDINQIPNEFAPVNFPAPAEAAAAEAAAAEAAAAEAAAAEEQSGFVLPPAGNDPNEAPYNGEGRSAAEDLAKLTGVPPKKLSKIERIRASRDEYAPLFQELMGDNKADMKTNALLMLADAGFKFAGATEPTMAMSLAKSAEGIPKGFAALIAQAKDRKLKLDSAALTQAITDVNAQDAYAQAQQLKFLDIDGRVLVAQAKAKGDKVTDGGLGGRVIEDKNGSFQGFSIDPNDPSVLSAIKSAYTLRDTDNPFVENLGEAPTTVETNKDERIKLGSALRSIDNALQEVNTLKRNFTELYSPGTWFTSKVNNLLVPIGGGLIRPDVDQKKAATTVGISLNRIMKAAASANDTGRIAVQEQEWERETQKALNKPEEFFKNKELTAGSINALEARFRNARQQILTQLGYEKNNYVMTTPNTGTQSDPFNLAGDLDYRNRMLTFLQSTIGKHSDKNATIYIINPKGVREAMSISQLNAIPRK